MASTAGYSRETTDALLAGLRQEFKADLKETEGALRIDMSGIRTEMKTMEGALRTEMRTMEGALRTDMANGFGLLAARLEGLRGEWKIRMVVLGAILTIVSSGLGSRALNLVWPPGPVGGPPGTSSAIGR